MPPRASLSTAEVYMQAYKTNTTYPAQETQRLFNTWSFNNCHGRNLCIFTKTQLSINTATIRKTTFPILQVVEQVHQQNCGLANVLRSLKILSLHSYIKLFSIQWFLPPAETSCVFPQSVLAVRISHDPQNKQRLFPFSRFVFVMTTKVCIFCEVKHGKVNVYEFALHIRGSVLINNLGNVHRAWYGLVLCAIVPRREICEHLRKTIVHWFFRPWFPGYEYLVPCYQTIPSHWKSFSRPCTFWLCKGQFPAEVQIFRILPLL